MAAVRSLVLTASIDDQDGIRRWVASVGEAVQVAQSALDDLVAALDSAPHIAITLRQGPEGSTDV